MRWARKRCAPPQINRVEEFAEVRINDPVDLALLDSDKHCIERIMLITPPPKAIGEADKVALVDGIEHGDQCVLNDFVLQRRNAQWSPRAIGLRDVGPSDRLCAVAAAVDRRVQRTQSGIQRPQILLPHHSIDPGRCVTLKRVEAFPEALRSEVMQKRCEARSLVPPRYLAHALQIRRRGCPALCPDRGSPQRVPLGRRPSFHSLRGLRPVRLLPKYYAVVRLPTSVPARLIASSIP